MFSSEVAQVLSSLSRVGSSDKSSIFSSKAEKWLFTALLITIAIVVVLGSLVYLTKVEWLKVAMLIMTLVFYFTAMLWQMSLAIPIFNFLLNPTRDVLRSLERSITKEISSMTGLASISTDTLQYVSDRLALTKEQLKVRTGLLVGMIEKVGVLPGIIASLLALSKVSTSGVLDVHNESLYLYIALAFFVFYGFALIGLLVSQRLEVYAGILDHYLKYRVNRIESNG